MAAGGGRTYFDTGRRIQVRGGNIRTSFVLKVDEIELDLTIDEADKVIKALTVAVAAARRVDPLE